MFSPSSEAQEIEVVFNAAEEKEGLVVFLSEIDSLDPKQEQKAGDAGLSEARIEKIYIQKKRIILGTECQFCKLFKDLEGSFEEPLRKFTDGIKPLSQKVFAITISILISSLGLHFLFSINITATLGKLRKLFISSLGVAICLGNYIRSDYRFYHNGRHVIYFKENGYGITVIRILHGRMLPNRHL